MKQSRLYFIASGLFFLAAALSILGDGVTWKTFAGLTIGAGMIVLHRNARKRANRVLEHDQLRLRHFIIASEAKQFSRLNGSGLLRRFAPRNDDLAEDYRALGAPAASTG